MSQLILQVHVLYIPMFKELSWLIFMYVLSLKKGISPTTGNFVYHLILFDLVAD